MLKNMQSYNPLPKRTKILALKVLLPKGKKIVDENTCDNQTRPIQPCQAIKTERCDSALSSSSSSSSYSSSKKSGKNFIQRAVGDFLSTSTSTTSDSSCSIEQCQTNDACTLQTDSGTSASKTPLPCRNVNFTSCHQHSHSLTVTKSTSSSCSYSRVRIPSLCNFDTIKEDCGGCNCGCNYCSGMCSGQPTSVNKKELGKFTYTELKDIIQDLVLCKLGNSKNEYGNGNLGPAQDSHYAYIYDVNGQVLDEENYSNAFPTGEFDQNEQIFTGPDFCYPTVGAAEQFQGTEHYLGSYASPELPHQFAQTFDENLGGLQDLPSGLSSGLSCDLTSDFPSGFSPDYSTTGCSYLQSSFPTSITPGTVQSFNEGQFYYNHQTTTNQQIHSPFMGSFSEPLADYSNCPIPVSIPQPCAFPTERFLPPVGGRSVAPTAANGLSPTEPAILNHGLSFNCNSCGTTNTFAKSFQTTNCGTQMTTVEHSSTCPRFNLQQGCQMNQQNHAVIYDEPAKVPVDPTIRKSTSRSYTSSRKTSESTRSSSDSRI